LEHSREIAFLAAEIARWTSFFTMSSYSWFDDRKQFSEALPLARPYLISE